MARLESSKHGGRIIRLKVFDIEANGFLTSDDPSRVASEIHCICVTDHGSEEVRTYTDAIPGYPSLAEGLADLSDADVLIGHNIQKYDIPMLQKFMGFETDATVRDTLIMSRMGYTALHEKDKRVGWKNPNFPRGLSGKHSLRAWGYRIGELKGHVNDTEDYSVCTQEMLDYCAQDVVVNDKLYGVFRKSWADALDTPGDNAIQIEHEFALALEEQQEAGWLIDTAKANDLIQILEKERKEHFGALEDLFPAVVLPPANDPDWVPGDDCPEDAIVMTKGNRWWDPLGTKQLKTKAKVIPFNPGSAQQVIWHLNRVHGWVPKKFSKKGNPTFNSDIIDSLPYDEARALSRLAMLSKRLSSMLGPSGFITLLGEDGRVHGTVHHCGAVTHRCTHNSPNSANITGSKAEFGHEMRSLFIAPPGYKIVGSDAQGLELRGLGNRMAQFDGGKYAREVVDGDAHSLNAQVAGLFDIHGPLPGEPDKVYRKRIRNEYAKSMIYAMNYGAGLLKLGRTIEPKGANWSDKEATARGKAVKAALLAGLPALNALIASLQSGYSKDGSQHIVGLDGRVAANRSRHQALNTQLQMDGAVVMKWATVFVRREAIRRWGNPGADKKWCMVAHVHDEYQFQVKEEIADELGKLAADSIRRAGEALGTTVELAGTYDIGDSWAETH